jgi:hypothetical protein
LSRSALRVQGERNKADHTGGESGTGVHTDELLLQRRSGRAL